MSPFVCVFILLGLSLANALEFTTVFEWDNSSFEGEEWKEQIKDLKHKRMVIYGERFFFTRWNFYYAEDCDVSLMSFSISSRNSSAPPSLHPFPHYSVNEESDCGYLYGASAMTTDTEGRLWVLENGLEDSDGKLWIFDLEDNDTVYLVHTFSRSIYDEEIPNFVFEDIVLDDSPDGWNAYIAEGSTNHLIIYNLKDNQSWIMKIIHRNIQAIALTPRGDKSELILSDIMSSLYSVPVSELRQGTQNMSRNFIDNSIVEVYDMVVDRNNVVYGAIAQKKYLARWDLTARPNCKKEIIFKDLELDAGQYYYPFTLALDANDTLWIMERRLEQKGDGYSVKYRLLMVEAEKRLPAPPAPCVPAGNASGQHIEDSSHPSPKKDVGFLRASITSNIVLVIVILWLKKMLEGSFNLSRTVSQMYILPADSEQIESDPPVEITKL